jgi:hypothetical protein
MGKSRASALGVDGLAHQEMQDIVRWKYHFTGNFDPSRLLSPIPVIKNGK